MKSSIGGAAIANNENNLEISADLIADICTFNNNDVLASTIFRVQQPIALFSHRGHAAIILALTAIISVISWKWNWILDNVISTGILGAIASFPLWGYCFYRAIAPPNNDLAAVAIGYLTFIIPWFECAQYAQLVWWAIDSFESSFQK